MHPEDSSTPELSPPASLSHSPSLLEVSTVLFPDYSNPVNTVPFSSGFFFASCLSGGPDHDDEQACVVEMEDTRVERRIQDGVDCHPGRVFDSL